MKTTQPKKRGPPVGSKNKFKNNSFAKKYKAEISNEGIADGQTKMDMFNDTIESANQVKSWKRGPISETVNLTYIFLAFIIGFSLCAVVMTPLVINSI